MGKRGLPACLPVIDLEIFLPCFTKCVPLLFAAVLAVQILSSQQVACYLCPVAHCLAVLAGLPPAGCRVNVPPSGWVVKMSESPGSPMGLAGPACTFFFSR